MSTQQTFKRYAIRYRDSSGYSYEDSVYASDAMEAQNLAMEFNEELRRRPHSITAVLQTPNWKFVFVNEESKEIINVKTPFH